MRSWALWSLVNINHKPTKDFCQDDEGWCWLMVNVDDKVRMDLSPVVCPSCRFASAPCRIVLNPWNSRIDNQIVFRLFVFCEFFHHDDYNWVWLQWMIDYNWWWLQLSLHNDDCDFDLEKKPPQVLTKSHRTAACHAEFDHFNVLTMILICWQWEVATWQRQWRHCHTHGQRVHLKAPLSPFVCKDPHNCHNCHHNSRHNDDHDQPHLACFPSMASRVW